jgi:hypothetical protein
MKAGEVIVYVEGPSDESAIEALLESLIQQKRREGVVIEFFEAPRGDKKVSLLTKVPRKAVGIILDKPHSIVVAIPDLYPRNKGFPHETVDELRAGILKNFNDALRNRDVEDDVRLRDRFRVFCFKYDLEALILASEEALKNRLGLDNLEVTWRTPVEDQDHDHPPKRIVEALFKEHGKRYRGTVDAPPILRASDYQDIADRCSQCFKPFVKFLTDLQPVSYHDEHDQPKE